MLSDILESAAELSPNVFYHLRTYTRKPWKMYVQADACRNRHTCAHRYTQLFADIHIYKHAHACACMYRSTCESCEAMTSSKRRRGGGGKNWGGEEKKVVGRDVYVIIIIEKLLFMSNIGEWGFVYILESLINFARPFSKKLNDAKMLRNASNGTPKRLWRMQYQLECSI